MKDPYAGHEQYCPDYAKIRLTIEQAIKLQEHKTLSQALDAVRFALSVLESEVEMIEAGICNQNGAQK